MQGVIEERGGRPHRDKLRTKQLGRSGQLSNPIREALILPPKNNFILPDHSSGWY